MKLRRTLLCIEVKLHETEKNIVVYRGEMLFIEVKLHETEKNIVLYRGETARN